MPPNRRNDEYLPETFLLRTLYRVFRFLNHVRFQLLVCAVLAGTLALAFTIYKSTRPDAAPEIMPVTPAALTNDNVLTWVNTAHKLAEKRRAGSFKVRVDSLKAFIEWSRTRSIFLSDKLEGMSVQEFLGIAASIENARRNIRILVEYDMLVQEQHALLEVNPAVQLPSLNQPNMNQADQTDLKMYEYHLNAVEAVLFDLIPGIRLPVPAWETQSVAASTQQVEGREDGTAPPPDKIQWKIVNPSRYGPRVIKVR